VARSSSASRVGREAAVALHQLIRHHHVVPEHASSAPRVFGLTRRELLWPAAAAVLLLAINKLVVHDEGSFFGSVLIVGFALGVLGVHMSKYLRRVTAGR
jgi:hypothetical protein